MIYIYDRADDQAKVIEMREDVNDVAQTLNGSQILERGYKRDVLRTMAVLGTARASYETVFWNRKGPEHIIYEDYIITIK